MTTRWIKKNTVVCSDGITKRGAWCKKIKWKPLFSVLKKGS